MTPLAPKIPEKKCREKRRKKRKKFWEKKGVNGAKRRHGIQKAMIRSSTKGVFDGVRLEDLPRHTKKKFFTDEIVDQPKKSEHAREHALYNFLINMKRARDEKRKKETEKHLLIQSEN